MEKIANFNHKIFVKLPLGIQSLLKSLPYPDFSIIIIVLGTVLFLTILIINLYSQVKTEIQLQESVKISQKTENPTSNPKTTQRRRRPQIQKTD